VCLLAGNVAVVFLSRVEFAKGDGNILINTEDDLENLLDRKT